MSDGQTHAHAVTAAALRQMATPLVPVPAAGEAVPE